MPERLKASNWVFLPIEVDTEPQWSHVKVRMYPTFFVFCNGKWTKSEGVLTAAKLQDIVAGKQVSVSSPASPVQSTVQDLAYKPRWQNFDGKSRMRHAVEDHGIDIRGKSEAQVLREMDAYHDRFGGGHPVKLSSFQSAGCPGGSCPTQQRSFFARR